MLFLSLKDAQEAQFQKDSDAIVRQRARTAASPVLNPPGNPAVAEAVNAAQSASTNVNAVLVTVARGRSR
jgi:putative ABC transport system permease protein